MESASRYCDDAKFALVMGELVLFRPLEIQCLTHFLRIAIWHNFVWTLEWRRNCGVDYDGGKRCLIVRWRRGMEARVMDVPNVDSTPPPPLPAFPVRGMKPPNASPVFFQIGDFSAGYDDDFATLTTGLRR